MKERMEDLDETIEAILSSSKSSTVEEIFQRQGSSISTIGSGRLKTVYSRDVGEEALGATCEGHKQDTRLSGSSHGENVTEPMDKSLRFTSFGCTKAREKLFEFAFDRAGNSTKVASDDTTRGEGKSDGIMGMKPFGSSQPKRSGESAYECSGNSFVDLEEILGLGTVDRDRSCSQVPAPGGEDQGGGTNAGSEAAMMWNNCSTRPLSVSGTRGAYCVEPDAYETTNRSFQTGHTEADRWLRDNFVGTDRMVLDGFQDTGVRKATFDAQRSSLDHRRSGERQSLHHHLPSRPVEAEQRHFRGSLDMAGGQQMHRPHPYDVALRHKRFRTPDSLLFRNPMGSLDQLKSQVYYRMKKRRRLNSGTWSLGDNLSMVHPARLSSLEFVSGCSVAGSPYVSACTSLPLILNSSGEMVPENIGVAQSFKKIAESMDFSNVTVFQLKQLMRDYGLNHAGKKNDLIDRIKNTLQEIDCVFKRDKSRIRREGPKDDKKEEAVYDKFFF